MSVTRINLPRVEFSSSSSLFGHFHENWTALGVHMLEETVKARVMADVNEKKGKYEPGYTE